MITDHHFGFSSPQRPQRQTSVLFIESQEGLNHIVSTFGFGISKQRMRSAVSVPQRESTVIHPPVCLMNLFIGTPIRTVYITEDSRSKHTVIQGCIEFHLVIGIIALYFNLTQLFVPFSLGFSYITVEIIVWSFCLQIFRCPLSTDT